MSNRPGHCRPCGCSATRVSCQHGGSSITSRSVQARLTRESLLVMPLPQPLPQPFQPQRLRSHLPLARRSHSDPRPLQLPLLVARQPSELSHLRGRLQVRLRPWRSAQVLLPVSRRGMHLRPPRLARHLSVPIKHLLLSANLPQRPWETRCLLGRRGQPAVLPRRLANLGFPAWDQVGARYLEAAPAPRRRLEGSLALRVKEALRR